MQHPNEKNENELENINAQNTGKLEDVLGKGDSLFGAGVSDDDNGESPAENVAQSDDGPNPDKSNEDGEIDHEAGRDDHED